MGKKKDVSEWLSRSDAEWAEQYIKAHLRDAHIEESIAFQPSSPPEPDRRALPGPVPLTTPLARVQTAITTLEKIPKGREIVSGLKNALKQRRYRSARNGKKPCTFSLPNATLSTLRKIAKMQGQTQTEVVTALIDGTEKETGKLQRKIKAQEEMLQNEREWRESEADLLEKQQNEALKLLEHYLRDLAIWITTQGEKLPNADLDEAAIKQLVDERMKHARLVLRSAVLKGMLSNLPDQNEGPPQREKSRTTW